MKKSQQSFEDPELDHIEQSEITAFVDISLIGDDQVSRPIVIEQEGNLITITNSDAKRLLAFLKRAVNFVGEFEKRNLQ